MKRTIPLLGECLVVGMAVCLLAIGAASAEDCTKARDVYAAGAKLMNFEDRARAFQEAVDLCPSFAEAHCNLADAFENLAALAETDVLKFNQLLDKAMAGYKEALKHNAKLFSAQLGLGDTCRVVGLYDESERAYKRALELKPGHLKAVSGIEKIRIVKSQDHGGFKNAEEIVSHFKTTSADAGTGNLMGFANHTVVKDRLRFDNILFDEWSADLKRGEAVRQLGEIGRALSSKDLSGCDFVVEGHTDNRGDYDRNMKLSGDRAESVKAYLIAQYRIDPSRISTQGFGYARPKFSNDTDENRLKNRRVELLFMEGRGRKQGQ
jgi:outer membrane protein OmpA-like peptidoglycan-associated protein